MERASVARSSSPAITVDALVMPAYHEKVNMRSIVPPEPIKSSLGTTRTKPPSAGQGSVENANPRVKSVEITREELDAKLAQNKAEVDVIASEMRREMAEFRAFQARQFSTMNTSISEIKSQISDVNGKFSGLNGKIDGLNAQIDGLKTTSTTLQWMVGAILALLAVILVLPQVQAYLKPVEIIQQAPAPQNNK
ncbi:hypothetical protein KC768_004706 [Salmonella enterica]|uniref:Uncharacterized protein n=1 Tax=Salmonella enterica TaxID=28901 RepID=A0A5Y3ZS58_SALER|nr:hypothetical protein [Salmonella enterica]ECD6965850.1 hypothetical protein [Salmonella enterica subsp. enterica serovar Java]EDI1587395.1 hypothetical protein [Salmonella enterica subsp. enterica serovar Paratyphi B]EDL7245962.1 hypothetical protein [Salmonella enterica subsp. enterica serovar Stanley]EDQ6022268.1 hypothetical protein [Salmonella enterica subsp. enterica]EDR4729334.1 hypothetical protein [Salmonella enterica subsp. enterica serovar 4,[5],12:b:-]HBM0061155.1 hypothetical p